MPRGENARAASWNGMNWIRQDKRLAIYLRDGMACIWCGVGVEDEGTTLTLDHLVPARGKASADNRSRNLVTACTRCNSARGKRGIAEFAEAVSEYLDHNPEPAAIVAKITRHRRRSLKAYRQQAKDLIADRGSAARVVDSIRESS